MLSNIDTLTKQIETMTLVRRARAIDGMSDAFQSVYRLLPALLHFNHPQLPGYEQDSPYGIVNYFPDSYGELEILLPDAQQLLLSNADTAIGIFGLYSMGSTSSIGQSFSSDLDIWVCIDKTLNVDKRHSLKKKCQKLECWAAEQSIEVNFFILDEERFFRGNNECLNNDNCGSTQHILLLEEFYRTVTHLAGKHLLWFVVPPQEESTSDIYQSYEQLVNEMCHHGVIKREEWVDFGPLSALSSKEYYGANLWQIYKSIDSPYKSVLKALLLEAYIWMYPSIQLLAAESKALFQQNNDAFYQIDHYYILLERVTRYLTAIHDHERLELARRCFYLKVQEKLSSPCEHPSWRRKALQSIVQQWNWSAAHIAKLDRQSSWQLSDVRNEYDILLRAIMKSFRNLNHFRRRNNLDSSVSPQDMTTLTRKLYTAYENLPDKVSLFTPYLIKQLAEKNLTFIYVAEGGVNRSGWYLYNKAPIIHEIIGFQPIEYQKNLVKLVAWCHFNGMLTSQTQMFVKSSSYCCSLEKLQKLVSDIRRYFPICIPAASEDALCKPSQITQMAIFLNLENDPTRFIANKVLNNMPVTIDVFNFGNQQRNLIGAIDVLYRNSWNEVRVLHFEGSYCVIDALKALLGRIHKDAGLPDSIKILNYSQNCTQEITEKTQELVEQCIMLHLSTTKQNLAKFKPLRIAGLTWGLFFERIGITVNQFSNAMDFYGEISKNKITPSHIDKSNTLSELPSVIEDLASEGIIQFFFEDTAAGFDLYILNEENKIEIYRNCNGSKDIIIREVNNYHAISKDHPLTSATTGNFNFPQFYKVINTGEHKQVIPFYRDKYNHLPETRLYKD